MVYAISTMPALVLSAHGAYSRLTIRHYLVDAFPWRQLPVTQQRGHGLALLRGPTPEAALVLYRPGKCSIARAMAIPGGLARASVAMMAPLIMASQRRQFTELDSRFCTGLQVHGCCHGSRVGV